MKVEELRIGNLVWRPCCNDEVVEIRENGIIGLDRSRGLIPFSELKPILLTDELLLNNGFELTKKPAIKNVRLPIKIIDRYVYIRKVDDINIEFDESRLFINNDLFTKALLFEDVKYIHEIQNAYQLLTKKELKIEL